MTKQLLRNHCVDNHKILVKICIWNNVRYAMAISWIGYVLMALLLLIIGAQMERRLETFFWMLGAITFIAFGTLFLPIPEEMYQIENKNSKSLFLSEEEAKTLREKVPQAKRLALWMIIAPIKYAIDLCVFLKRICLHKAHHTFA